MKTKYSKASVLDYKMYSLWPTYTTTDNVPQELKDQVDPNDGFVLMVNILGTPNTLQAWNGSSWIIIGEANDGNIAVETGTTANRPASPTTGQLYFDTDEDRLIIYEDSQWKVNARVPAGSTRPADGRTGEFYYLTDDNTLQVYNGSSWDRCSGGAYAKSGNYAGRPSYHVKGEMYCVDDAGGSIYWNGSFWQSASVKVRNGEPSSSDGKYGGQMVFRVESGKLYIWTGTQWYRFDGTLV